MFIGFSLLNYDAVILHPSREFAYDLLENKCSKIEVKNHL